MNHKISVSKCLVRGVVKWRVRWHELGRVHRKFFSGRDSADAHAATVRGDAISARKRLQALPQADQEHLFGIYTEATKRNISLASVVSLLPLTSKSESPAIETVLAEMEIAKRKAGRAGRYLHSLNVIGSGLMQGREKLAVDKFTVQDVERFLDSKNIQSRSTLRARLSTLFKFAVRRGYRSDNPCNQLESVTLAHVPPAILTVAETKKCLDWLRLNPRSLGWFVLSTFAGLRPEEAEKTSWREINFKEGWIRVEAQTTKVRQRRVVYPPPVAIAWLRVAKRLKSSLPLGQRSRTRDRISLRGLLGWSEWKQDCTRHTAASMWLASCGSAATVGTALGHSESVLRRHYMAVVTKADAEKFYALKP
jgi:integrase